MVKLPTIGVGLAEVKSNSIFQPKKHSKVYAFDMSVQRVWNSKCAKDTLNLNKQFNSCNNIKQVFFGMKLLSIISS